MAYEGRLDLEKFKSVFARKTDALFYEMKALITLLGAYYQQNAELHTIAKNLSANV